MIHDTPFGVYLFSFLFKPYITSMKHNKHLTHKEHMMKRVGKFLVCQKTTGNSDERLLVLSENLTGFEVLQRKPRMMLHLMSGSTEVSIPYTPAEASVDILCGILKENLIDTKEDDNSLIITVINAGDIPNLLVNQEITKTVSFSLSEVYLARTRDSYIELYLHNKPAITISFTSSVDEVIENIFNTPVDKITKLGDISTMVYLV